MADQLANLLNLILPDEKILSDLWETVDDGNNKVELNDTWIEIPNKTQIDIVTKAYFLESFPNIGFGVYKVLLALGGFNQGLHGFHSAGICFSTMIYDRKSDLITLDFHKDFR
ncbi:hypothetical protein HRE53_24095 [Acaryochloris sp. 'Moss Beach']|uniref:hypothetical protein n=1 Tax=Acaryochloris sp. 'Moss Beach' TaxID=2740837 RepID=UPI001F30303E|nr:hypothetical protein [Acaryochloris sp. 'Moss Beach']UJB69397.1 hypothetical protein HRE53_24095 [Acaryochloris sp. 'Moss Beach']